MPSVFPSRISCRWMPSFLGHVCGVHVDGNGDRNEYEVVEVDKMVD